MPEINQIKSLNYKNYIYLACVECGHQRWVQCDNLKRPTFTSRCLACQTKRLVRVNIGRKHSPEWCRKVGEAHRGKIHSLETRLRLSLAFTGEKSHTWKGGKHHNHQGYIVVYLKPNHPFYCMADQAHYAREHRLVMAQHLGRCLQPWEIVHHLNGVRDDNRIENLELVTNTRHKQITSLQMRIRALEVENARLKAEILNRDFTITVEKEDKDEDIKPNT